MSKNKKSVSKKKQVSGGAKDSTKIKKSRDKSDLKFKHNHDTDFYIICGDCGGLGKIVILGENNGGTTIIY